MHSQKEEQQAKKPGMMTMGVIAIVLVIAMFVVYSTGADKITGNDMPQEIERNPRDGEYKPQAYAHSRIVQGYISSVRVDGQYG